MVDNVVSLRPGAVPACVVPIKVSRFQIGYGEWSKLHADLSNPNSKRSNKRTNADVDRLDALAVELTTTPASRGWMIRKKLEILSHHMKAGHGDQRSSLPGIVMVAGIEADIIRLETDGVLS